MSRRVIVMTVGAAVLVVAAIALAVLTRPSAGPLKASEPIGASSSPSPKRSTTPSAANDSFALAADANTVGDPAVPDLAGLGNADPEAGDDGSNGAQLARLQSEFAQHHWANAVAQCLSHDIAVAAATACAISACGIHDATRARMYYANVPPADRVAVQAACTDAHVELEGHRFFGPHHLPVRSPLRGSGG